jgi:hypothetical protein
MPSLVLVRTPRSAAASCPRRSPTAQGRPGRRRLRCRPRSAAATHGRLGRLPRQLRQPLPARRQKTIVFETLEQLAWQPPDYLVLPGGNLGNTAAFGKALRELFEAGLIDRVPKLVVVQAAGACPLRRLLDGGWERFAAVQAETVATAIKIGNPASTARARRSSSSPAGWSPA